MDKFGRRERQEWNGPEDLMPARSDCLKEWEQSGESDEQSLVMAWHLDVHNEGFGGKSALMGTIKLKGSMNGTLLISIE